MSKSLKHIVLFKFLDNTPEKKIEEIISEFIELKNKIEVISEIEWGKDISTEQKNQGFTHCFCLTFLDQEGRDEYLPHPEHEKFGNLLKPYLEKVLVFDYVNNPIKR
jgi:hypothetical protein